MGYYQNKVSHVYIVSADSFFYSFIQNNITENVTFS